MPCVSWLYYSFIFSLFYKNVWRLLTFLSYSDWYSKLHPRETEKRKQELNPTRQSIRLHTAWRKHFTAEQMAVKNKMFSWSLADAICTNSLLESNYQKYQYNTSICKTLYLFFNQLCQKFTEFFFLRHFFQQSPITFLYVPAISVHGAADFRKRRAFNDPQKRSNAG